MPRRGKAILIGGGERFVRSAALAAFERDLAVVGHEAGDTLQYEYPFAAGRRFRFDYCFLRSRIAVEVVGVWRASPAGGGHGGIAQLRSDAEKFSLAAAGGWRIVFATHRQVRSGKAIAWVRAAFLWRTSEQIQEMKRTAEAPIRATGRGTEEEATNP